MNLAGLTNYYTKQEINGFASLNKYYNKNESDSKYQGAFKQTASCLNGACIYENLQMSARDAFDGYI